MSDMQDLQNAPSVSTNQRASWSTIITVIVIVGVIVVGAFYVWGERVSEERLNQGVPAEGSERSGS